jgi:hypothetical protein
MPKPEPVNIAPHPRFPFFQEELRLIFILTQSRQDKILCAFASLREKISLRLGVS